MTDVNFADQNSIGGMVTRWMEKTITEPKLLERMRPAFPVIGEAVESLCPVVFQAGGEKAFLTSQYGPSPELAKTGVILFVTNTGCCMVSTNNGFPSDNSIRKAKEAVLKESEADDLKHCDALLRMAIFKLLEKANPEDLGHILELWTLWVGVEGKRNIISEIKEIKRAGHVPLVINFFTELGGGGMGVVGLPPAIRID